MVEEWQRPNRLPDFRAMPWDDLYPPLLWAARVRIMRLVWRGELRGHAPGGRTEHDFVQTAVEKLMSGKRRWDLEKGAYENLWDAVAGEINNCVRGADNKRIRRMDDDTIALFRADLPSPEDHADWLSERDKLLKFLCHNTDKDVSKMAELMLVEGLNSFEVGEKLGLKRHAIDATRKRLSRMLNFYLTMELV